MAAWDELIWMVWACIRAAMKRSAAGGIAWSWLATRYQAGMVFQAGTPEGCPRVASAAGRCAAAITPAGRAEQSAQKASRKTLGLMQRISAEQVHRSRCDPTRARQPD